MMLDLCDKIIVGFLWIVIVVAVVLAITGCASPDFHLNFSSIGLAGAWPTACGIEYKSEPAGEDHWQSPEETIRLGTGDCEDKALLLWYVLRHVRGVKDVRLVVGQTHVVLHHAHHAWVEVGKGMGTLVMDPTAEQVFVRYMLSPFAYIPVNSKDYDIKAEAFMKRTGYRNLNPDVGWK